MSVVISVYGIHAFREYILPTVRNGEAVLMLDQQFFQLRSAISLHLDNLDNRWSILDAKGAAVSFQGKKLDGRLELRDKNRYMLRSEFGEELSAIVSVKETSFRSYQKFVLTGQGDLSIGQGAENAIQYSYTDDRGEYISRCMAVLHMNRQSVSIEDRGKNGIFVNDTRVAGSRPLVFGDHIHIWGLDMVFLGGVLAIREDASVRIHGNALLPWNGACPPPDHENHPNRKTVYHRAPRNMEKIETEAVEIESPPQPKAVQETPLLMLIGPSLTMAIPMSLSSGMAIISSQLSGTSSSVFMYTGVITAICSALIGSIWAIVNLRANRKRALQEENQRFEAYSEYLIRSADNIKSKYENNIAAMSKMYPAAAFCVSREYLKLNLLWGRNSSHPDVFAYRMGIGDQPFQVPINVPKEKFTLINDSLSDKPRMIQESYKVLRNVPICVDMLENNVVGLIGGSGKRGARALLLCLAAQIASQNCYTDVKMAFVYKEDQGEDASLWEFAKWLPHTWSQDRKLRFVASSQESASDVFYELAKVLRERAEAASSSFHKQSLYKPHYVLFVEDGAMLEGELLAKFVLDSEKPIGVTLVLMAETYEELPNSCECILQNDGHFQGLYNVRSGERTPIRFDAVDARQMLEFARTLANMEVTETEVGGDIPMAINFFDLYGVSRLSDFHVEERWKKNRNYVSMRALIGQMAGGAPCYLDVHEKYHGPHGLVAGTTGSGKSETLQTYMLSLALSYSPDDIGFFIIDYKGGGMANLFDGLPHLLGSISNLSGNQVRRAMVSIKSENRRRQRIFTENGVNNINAYTQLYKNGETDTPVPHLFIIIDEFAELKREESDFMRELISVAQVGRSLGVHLILATQKPSGTVDDNIWSNSKFRLCLRVQDKQDSMDMLHKADAAYITQAGRGYLQVGNDELYELFQSGWSGADYSEETGNQKQVLASMLSDTGKAALVGSHSMKKQKEQQKLKWFRDLHRYLQAAREGLQGAGTAGVPEQPDSQLVDRMFDCMRTEADFPKNDYNAKALRNYIGLVAKLENGDAAYTSMSEDQQGLFLMRTAEQRNLKMPEIKGKTQLDAIVEYLGQVAKREGYREVQKLWLPVLPEKIPLSALEAYQEGIFRNGAWPSYAGKWSLGTMIGLCDDPANQMQMPMEINFTENGNHAILGIAMSGKSTLMQSIAYSLIHRYSPEYLNIYALDFSSRMLSVFEKAPHCGGVLYESDLETVGKFFRMIEKMIERRKRLFQGGNYSQYVMTHGMDVPAVLILIDNMAGFREKTELKYDDELLRLTRECTPYGIYFLVSAAGFNMTEIPGRMRDNIHTVISMEMPDKFQYAEALNTMSVSVIPEPGIHGRGLVIMEGRTLEMQAAIAVESGDDYDRNDKIRASCLALGKAWDGKTAAPIPKIPENPTWEDFESREEVLEYCEDDRHLPFAYEQETADIAYIDLSETYTYLIHGKARTGKSNVLRLLAMAAARRQGKAVFIEIGSQKMRVFAESLEARYITDYDAFRAFMLSEFIPAFQERNKLKTALMGEGLEEEEVYQRMRQFQEYYVFIDGLAPFVKMMYEPAATKENMHNGFANLVEKGFLHRIYLFATLDADERGEVVNRDIYLKFIRSKAGIHLGGNVIQQRLFDFTGMPMSQQSAIEKPGTGVIPPTGDAPYRRVVLPLLRAARGAAQKAEQEVPEGQEGETE